MMKSHRINIIVFLYLTLLISFIYIIPCSAQVIKTTISDILAKGEKYHGKVVQVEGKAMFVKFKVSRKGNPYTTFKLTDNKGNALNVFSFGTLKIYDNDKVRVTGKYHLFKHVGIYTFYNQIDTSEGKVERIR